MNKHGDFLFGLAVFIGVVLVFIGGFSLIWRQQTIDQNRKTLLIQACHTVDDPNAKAECLKDVDY